MINYYDEGRRSEKRLHEKFYSRMWEKRVKLYGYRLMLLTFLDELIVNPEVINVIDVCTFFLSRLG